MGIQLVLSQAQLSAAPASWEESAEGEDSAVEQRIPKSNHVQWSIFTWGNTGPNSNSAIKCYSIIFPLCHLPSGWTQPDDSIWASADCLLQAPFIYIYMRLKDGEERKRWLKLSFFIKKKKQTKNHQKNQTKAMALFPREVPTLRMPPPCSLPVIFPLPPDSSIPLSHLGRHGAALPRTAAPGCSTSAAKLYFALTPLFLRKAFICLTQGNTVTPKLLLFPGQRPCAGRRVPHHPAAWEC